jgi:glycosyltransferase involved in cell wall biosynthesis
MAVGNAAVASTADGQGEILEDGKTALLHAPGDWERMATLILRLLNDDALRESLRRQASERIRDFDMKRCLTAMEETYEAIAPGARKP